MKSLLGSGAGRMALLLVLYTLGLVFSIWFSYQLRFDFNVPSEYLIHFWRVCATMVAIKLLSLGAFRQFAGLLSYFSIPDLMLLFSAMASGSLVMGLIRWQTSLNYSPPRGVILADFVVSFVGLAGIRLALRLIRERYLSPPSHRRARRVGIIGAGDAGANLARELSVKRGMGLLPVAFFDDDRRKWKSRVHDIAVIGPPEALLDQKQNLALDEVIIAMPSAPAKRIGEVVQLLRRAHLTFETVPSLEQLATGKVKMSQLRSVDIQDLLGREPVKLEAENISHILKDRVVLVTGAGGSIGSELCRQIATYHPSRLLLLDQSEVQLFPIEQELIELGYGGVILPLVADILDLPRMRYIFERFKPNVIFHAAAHKHVPMMESQPSEAIKNNTLGTAQVARLAADHAVDRFVLISTDKAINPTNVMGATKRLAEIFVQALHACQSGSTKFIAVRFGNVLGSSGSVIPIFHKQIAAGGPVKVTHPEVTRYFMTIPEAAGLVLQSGAQGQGGEIFVLDMGKPVKIIDLARQMIELSGFVPDEDIEIEFVGLRPGEKLFEELSHTGENITPTNHPKIMRFVSQPQDFEQVQRDLERLTCEIHRTERNQIKMMLKQMVPEYQPYLT